MNGKRYLALAVLALQNGNKEACDEFMAKAAEFGDDLTDWVTQIIRTGNSATRNAPATPQAENTIAPSLHAVASAKFINDVDRLSRDIAIASYLDPDEELEEQQADESFDTLDDLETDVEGFDEDQEEATASTTSGCGPVRYKQ